MAETLTAPTRTLATSKIAARMRNPWLLRGFMLAKLPLALFAGLRMRELTDDRCVVSVPYGWRSTNPFRSTYFAALSMAAEMSTGAPAMMAVEMASQPVAMLIVGMEASFEKKATSTTAFVCEDGHKAFAAVAETIRTGEPVTVRMETVGRMPDNALVARFVFTWSFKRRSQR